MSKTNLPGFTAEASLRTSESYYRCHANSNSLSHKDAVISPAFRVSCGSDTTLGATCTILGGLNFFR